ncbi:thermonuclease family protein [Variovorax sp. JS1663]|uniref:thermonuclease family protein n=1 Tax=Variovorax sp. JS1663 TaxID=1851577 RepID=UPI000B341C9C|nr:thermonuclease family protein [Variovorax sp. JS1663]OUM04025.1 nuclease [Variovorax sp. JS1663]
MFSAALFCLVVAISDGDTLKVRCGEPGAFRQLTVRLHAIDAPELNQPFGRRAKQALSRIAYRKEARLDCGEDDRYHRRVCRVRVAPESCAEARCPKTLDAGLGMLTLGLAWWARGYADEQPPGERGQYAFAEFEAKGKRAGLWADRNPVPPWRWRAGHPHPR